MCPDLTYEGPGLARVSALEGAVVLSDVKRGGMSLDVYG